MRDVSLDLSFPCVEFGKRETPWTLAPLLINGGAGTDKRYAKSNSTKKIISERIPLVKDIHDCINSALVMGGSRYTAWSKIQAVRKFYSWIDTTNKQPTHASIANLYFEWCETLISESRPRNARSLESSRNIASQVSTVFSEVLELKRSIFQSTRLSKKNRGSNTKTPSHEKSNLSYCYSFGNMLLDIIQAITIDAVTGPLPLTINFRTGQKITQWGGNKKSKSRNINLPLSTIINAAAAKEQYSDITARQTLINLRVVSELLVFISQTQLNLSQACALKIGKFSFIRQHSGLGARRVYKNRSHGEVEFELFSEYKAVFTKYINWRNEIFDGSDDERLFPTISTQGRSSDKPPSFYSIKQKCKQIGITFIGPRELRGIKVNWLSRKSKDPQLAADMAQHTIQTSLSHYQTPCHQIALIEISEFHKKTEAIFEAPAPGGCALKQPERLPTAHPESPEPNCINPSGCLYCAQHRDINSFDHIWSLASYRYLKSLELTILRRPGKNLTLAPKDVVDIVTDKIKAFSEIDEERRSWVQEAMNRIKEEDYHPKWSGFIRLNELAI